MLTNVLTAALPRWMRPFVAVLGGYSGFGHTIYEVDASGEPVERESVYTVKMRRGEDISAFVARLRREQVWQPGDQVEFIANGGSLDVVKITRKAERG